MKRFSTMSTAYVSIQHRRPHPRWVLTSTDTVLTPDLVEKFENLERICLRFFAHNNFDGETFVEMYGKLCGGIRSVDWVLRHCPHVFWLQSISEKGSRESLVFSEETGRLQNSRAASRTSDLLECNQPPRCHQPRTNLDRGQSLPFGRMI